MTTKLIIGLGNAGPEYDQTRHNIGFLFLDTLAKKAGHKPTDFAFDKASNANTLEIKNILQATELIEAKSLKKSNAILAKSLRYVNETGFTAAKLKNRYKVKNEDIIVVQDDLDIPFGKTKVSFERNSGGHRGIESIIKALKTNKFYRIRIGTSTTAVLKAHGGTEEKRDSFVKNFVLNTFTPAEHAKLNSILKEALAKLGTILQS